MRGASAFARSCATALMTRMLREPGSICLDKVHAHLHFPNGAVMSLSGVSRVSPPGACAAR